MDHLHDNARPESAEARADDYSPSYRPERIMGRRLRGPAHDAAIARAIEWRESRRCHCGALAFQSCAHREIDEEPKRNLRITTLHMPFRGHRTCAEVFADEESQRIRRGLGR